MGLKDAFKGDKWYKPLGKSTHGGQAWEGRTGAAAAEARAKANVQQAKAIMKACKKCQKLKVPCNAHKSQEVIIRKKGK